MGRAKAAISHHFSLSVARRVGKLVDQSRVETRMKENWLCEVSFFLAAAVIIGTGAEAQEIDWKKIDDALGRSAAVTGDVHRYGFPRTDLSVTLEGVAIKPALALGGWTAFKPVHGGAMMMGDLVLLETEITPVLTAAIENGLEITAIHNHVLRANPPTFYMHVSGHGDPVKLANALHTTLAASKNLFMVRP